MNLKQLKEKYPLVYQRVEIQAIDPPQLNSILGDVSTALSWHKTTEGSNFWSAVYNEEWDLAKELQPSLFLEIEKESVKIITNGLFKSTI